MAAMNIKFSSAMAFITLSLLGSSMVANAQVYTWLDARGNRHYGDSSISPVGATVFQTRNDTASPPTSEPSKQTRQPTSLSPTDEAEAKAKAEVQAETCRIARKNATLLGNDKMDVLSDDGKSIMDAQSRAQKKALMDMQAATDCNQEGAP